MRTKDIHQAAAFIAIGFPYSMEKDDGGTAWFDFEDTPEMEGINDLYWNKKIKVDPLSYNDNCKQLKVRIFENY